MRVLFAGSFAKDLHKYRKNRKFIAQVQSVVESTEQAESATDINGLKQLKAEGEYYRIRTGDYRIGIIIKDGVVTFLRALHRSKIYRFFP